MNHSVRRFHVLDGDKLVIDAQAVTAVDGQPMSGERRSARNAGEVLAGHTAFDDMIRKNAHEFVAVLRPHQALELALVHVLKRRVGGREYGEGAAAAEFFAVAGGLNRGEEAGKLTGGRSDFEHVAIDAGLDAFEIDDKEGRARLRERRRVRACEGGCHQGGAKEDRFHAEQTRASGIGSEMNADGLALNEGCGENGGMSVWTRILELAGRAFDPEAEPPEFGEECAPRPNDVGFTAAVIGLAAKMAKADGEASETELRAAARVFRPPAGEEENFRRAFSLAKQTVLGFESYARQIGRKYRARPCLLEDVLDGLFHIAGADGHVGDRELDYLHKVATHFGFSDLEFRRIKATNLGPEAGDPYAILGLLPGATMEEVRQAWRRAAAENHPDRMAQRGAPPEFVDIARDKTAAINAAYARIRQDMNVSAK